MRDQFYNILVPIHKFFMRYNRDNLKVLAYHTVPDKENFERQLIWLKASYNIISLQDLKDYFVNKTALPSNPLLITFDDGDISVFTNGLPVLKKHAIPSILFIISGLIDTMDAVWIKRVEQGEMDSGKTYIEAREVVTHFKNIPNEERKKLMQSYSEISQKQLTELHLKEMEDAAMYICNHTHTHPMIDYCSKDEIEEELEMSKSEFNEWGLDGYSVFAYPNGNWDKSSEKILKEEGIEMAFLFDHKINNKNINPMRISRIRVDTDTEIDEFKVKVSGFHSILMGLKDRLL